LDLTIPVKDGHCRQVLEGHVIEVPEERAGEPLTHGYAEPVEPEGQRDSPDQVSGRGRGWGEPAGPPGRCSPPRCRVTLRRR
jgi:hypothetical protein